MYDFVKHMKEDDIMEVITYIATLGFQKKWGRRQAIVKLYFVQSCNLWERLESNPQK